MELCPCGLGDALDKCCLPLITGQKVALTPEVLMRSRYTAFVLQAYDYIFRTWHVDFRPSLEDIVGDSENVEWHHLEVLNSQRFSADRAIVEFVVEGVLRGAQEKYCEVSEFVKVDNVWFYTHPIELPIVSEKVNRNSACPCGSGKKYKKCCA